GAHIDMVHIGPLLPIHLDIHVELVHHRCHVGVLEALMRHYVTPMAGGIADGDQHRLVQTPRLGQGIRSPFPPMDRIVLVLQEIGRAGIREAIHRCVSQVAGSRA
ncbi:MAG: hypothetical protein K0Q80_2836, partial [Microvirga sp.]|nr:hypothetical protein [Microvirga sp.]